ncbi:hypothetical protein [Sedimenticola selenatireducens]|uniref:hypothetical protein n=1 Tax=Sedimenticola selenatireducens TaxID=191960 RepID=UPI002AABA6B9|nr:hypothetical protein [Sedimenticola selenatireducens]
MNNKVMVIAQVFDLIYIERLFNLEEFLPHSVIIDIKITLYGNGIASVFRLARVMTVPPPLMKACWFRLPWLPVVLPQAALRVTLGQQPPVITMI